MYWYDDNGTLLAANATSLTLNSLGAGASRHIIISATPIIHVWIIRPENALYFADNKLLAFRVPVAIGHLTIIAGTSGGAVDTVIFKLDGYTVCSTSTAPYDFTWTQRSFGPHQIKAIAYSGNITASVELRIWKFF